MSKESQVITGLVYSDRPIIDDGKVCTGSIDWSKGRLSPQVVQHFDQMGILT